MFITCILFSSLFMLTNRTFLFLFQVTCNYFQLMNAMASSAPVQYQTLAESSRLYEPGAQFAEFVRVQKAHSLLAKERVYTFEPYYPG